MFLPGDVHKVHVYCGWTILIDGTVHTAMHVARWADQGNLLQLLLHHPTGISGLVIVGSLLAICVPMIFCVGRLRFELRKYLHYLFIPFALGLCFHAPPSAFPNGGFGLWIFSTLLILYLLDSSYCFFFLTERIETTQFDVLPTGFGMTFKVSKAFQERGAQGGYCFVAFEWIDRLEWHAFSLFENPENPQERQLFACVSGDWTAKVHKALQRDTVRPAYIQGPFPSVYDNSVAYDNQILVASGIGVTPALSVIRAHKDSRRINLIWAVRDKHLLEFFLRHCNHLDNTGWNLIFYTGKDALDTDKFEVYTNTNISIFEGRPNLARLIPNIIYGIESKKGLPEKYSAEKKAEISDALITRMEANTRFMESWNGDEALHNEYVRLLSNMAAEKGFELDVTERSSDSSDASDEEEVCCNSSPDISTQSFRTTTNDFLECIKTPDLSRHVKVSSINKSLALGFRPWEYHRKASQYVKGLDKKLILPTWGLLYCGGAKMVEKAVKDLSDEYGIDSHIESFRW